MNQTSKLYEGAKALAMSLLYCLIFALSQFIVGIVLMIPYSVAQMTKMLDTNLSQDQKMQELLRRFTVDFIPQNTAVLTLLSAVLAVAALLLLLWRLYPPVKEELQLKKAKNRRGFLYLVPMAIGLQILITIVLNFVIQFPVMEYFAKQMEDYSASVTPGIHRELELLAVVVIAPVSEEIFFRGAIFSSLKRAKLPIWAVVGVQALLFGLIHGLFLQILYAFVIGLILGYLRVKFESLFPCMILHAAFNASGYISDLLPESIHPAILVILLLSALAITAASLILLKRSGQEEEKGENHAA